MENDVNALAKYRSDGKSTTVLTIISLILTGAATGVLSGFFGGGGGMLVVPALAAIMKISEKQSHATAIAVILPVTAVGAAVYGIKGVDLGVGFPYALLGVICGGLIGAALMNKLSNGFLSVIFYGLMIAAGIKMLL